MNSIDSVTISNEDLSNNILSGQCQELADQTELENASFLKLNISGHRTALFIAPKCTLFSNLFSPFNRSIIIINKRLAMFNLTFVSDN